MDEGGTKGSADVNSVLGSFKSMLDAITPTSLGLPSFSVGSFSVDHSWFPEIIGGSDSCVTPDAIHNFSIAGQPMNIDLCPLWQPYKDGLRWFLYAMTAVWAFFRVLRVFG